MQEARARTFWEQVGIWTAIVLGVAFQAAMLDGARVGNGADELFERYYAACVFWVALWWTGMYWLARWKNRRVSTWLALTVVLGPFATLILLCLPRSEGDMRQCEFCLSRVPTAARVCRYCQRELEAKTAG